LNGEQFWQAELHRINGLVLGAQNQPEEGQTCLQQALPLVLQQRLRAPARARTWP
jgi:hypothetical protein